VGAFAREHDVWVGLTAGKVFHITHGAEVQSLPIEKDGEVGVIVDGLDTGKGREKGEA